MTRSDIRTRIAPSPTGPCHLGTARTALFNYLFAKGNHGTFVFRLEDTDRERSTPEFEQELYDSLHWLGLHWDEGPDAGQPAAPKRSRLRTALSALRGWGRRAGERIGDLWPRPGARAPGLLV